MLEIFFLGIIIGAVIGMLFAKTMILMDIKDKASSKIDFNKNGTFYEIRFSKRNENYEELEKL